MTNQLSNDPMTKKGSGHRTAFGGIRHSNFVIDWSFVLGH
jgi:hypothetical protein